MSKLKSIIDGTRPPDIYRFASRMAVASVRRQLEAEGWRVFHLDGREIKNKALFLEACVAAMEFPSYFGKNWDAFEECLTDLSWVEADGYVIVYDHAEAFELNDPKEWRTALEILGNAIKAWHESGTPMYVLVRNSQAVFPVL